MILKFEYELSKLADKKGAVDFDAFFKTLVDMNIVKDILECELNIMYVNILGEDKKLHVQKFANRLRGQMPERRE